MKSAATSAPPAWPAWSGPVPGLHSMLQLHTSRVNFVHARYERLPVEMTFYFKKHWHVWNMIPKKNKWIESEIWIPSHFWVITPSYHPFLAGFSHGNPVGGHRLWAEGSKPGRPSARSDLKPRCHVEKHGLDLWKTPIVSIWFQWFQWFPVWKMV